MFRCHTTRHSFRTVLIFPCLLLTVSPLWLGPRDAHAAKALDFTGDTQILFQAAISFGWSFTVNETITVDGLGFFDDFSANGAGLLQDHLVRLWSDEAIPQVLASSTITNASTPVGSTAEEGQWLFNDITPVELAPGNYVIGADDPLCSGGGDCDGIRFRGVATTIPQITFGMNLNKSGFGFPDSHSPTDDRDDGYFGPTFSVVVPEPATIFLLFFGTVSLNLCRLGSSARR